LYLGVFKEPAGAGVQDRGVSTQLRRVVRQIAATCVCVKNGCSARNAVVVGFATDLGLFQLRFCGNPEGFFAESDVPVLCKGQAVL